jgi:hypothetical protein
MCTPSSTPPDSGLLRLWVEERFPAYRDDRDREDRPLPEFVLRDFAEYLACGDIKSRWATLECIDCSVRVTVSLHCKRRGWCPSCMQFRQMDRADFLEERIFGDTPVRQWVLTLPPPARVDLAFRPDLTSKVLRRHLGYIFQLHRRRAKRHLGIRKAHLLEAGAATVIQRFSTDLSLNLHFHSAVTDGVFFRRLPGDEVTFVELPAPTKQEITAIARKTCRFVKKLLAREGAWESVLGPWVNSMPTEAGYISLGKGPAQFVRWCGVAADKEIDEPAHRDGVYAFNLHVGKSVPRGDRKNLRKLLEYMLSPPFAEKDLHPDPQSKDHVLVDLKRPRLDGTQVMRLTFRQFFDRLVWITPRPRANLIRFHGVYAARFGQRSDVIPAIPEQPKPEPNPEETPEDYAAWGELVTHSYPKDIRHCRICRGQLRLIALKSDRISYRRRSGVPPDPLTST